MGSNLLFLEFPPERKEPSTHVHLSRTTHYVQKECSCIQLLFDVTLLTL